MKIESCFAVCFTGYKDRHPHLMAELERVGIKDPHVVWNFPSPYDRFVRVRIACIPQLNKNPGFFSAGIGHYRALKTAYGLGFQNALIVEDDCRFLNEVDKVYESLDKAPQDADFLLLDHFNVKGMREAKDGWAEFDRCRSSACYLVNRKAMARLIDMHESPVSGKFARPVMRICDHWSDRIYMGKVKMYVASPHLAIQCRCPNASNSGKDGVARFYRTVDLSKFANYDHSNHENKEEPPCAN